MSDEPKPKAESVWTKENVRLLIDLYNTKTPMKEIAETMGCCVSTCHVQLSRLRKKSLVGYHYPMQSNRMNPKINCGPNDGDEAVDNFEYIKFRRHAEWGAGKLLAALIETYGEIGSCSQATRSLPSSALPTNQRPASDTVSAG